MYFLIPVIYRHTLIHFGMKRNFLGVVSLAFLNSVSLVHLETFMNIKSDSYLPHKKWLEPRYDHQCAR